MPIWRGNVACVRLLVERGADINICRDPERGHTPLEYALAYGHHDVVTYLLTQGATRRPPPPPEWVARRRHHRTLLRAIKKRHCQTVQTLMHAGVSGYPLRITDAWPLVEAAKRGHLGVLMPLLAAGVSPNRFFDEAPLEVAAERGYVDVARALLAAGAAVDQSVEDGFTPLLAAAWHGHLDVVACLIEAGAHVNQWSQGANALTYAAAGGYEKLYAYLYPLVDEEIRAAGAREKQRRNRRQG